MPSTSAQIPHSTTSAVAVETGQTIATIPKTTPIAPRAISAFQPMSPVIRSPSRWCYSVISWPWTVRAQMIRISIAIMVTDQIG